LKFIIKITKKIPSLMRSNWRGEDIQIGEAKRQKGKKERIRQQLNGKCDGTNRADGFRHPAALLPH
jgi:hypothetical protein